ncbi:nucleoside deaminase [Hwanghaeella grinnelliae]|uniref:tRNA-specific adenosine deaminase n=1 Tax=Hwanghaeella grinnelliae TaxID=2500179 RepID=A0A437QU24_9PROT|nr:nucleoside deaminase [Hwanghaeella grinnelliae]RVU38015.1 nucleoside deaminase [Hwanghaeella grinnelliae]
MIRALEQANQAAERGESPIGAVIVDRATGEVLAEDGNRVEELKDPTAHAEMLVIRRAAAAKGSPRLIGCDLYVTLEPCPMCAGGISHARIEKLVYGAYDPKGGGVDHGARVFDRPTCNHKPDVISGVAEEECAALLKSFFQRKR